MKQALIVTLALVASACGKKKPDTGGGSTDPGTGGSGLMVAPVDAQGFPDDPTPPAIRDAFAGKPPVLPQLSKGGDHAAVELVTHVGVLGVTTYKVGFVTVGGASETVTLIDTKLAKALADTPTGKDTLDRDALQRAATTVAKRITDQAFSPFEGKVDELAHGEPETVGPGKLQLATGENDGLVITVFDASGQQVATETVNPTPMGKIDELECVSLPVPRSAHFDTARRRILLRVGWNPGPDQCDAPDPAYRLYAIP